jgi:hypothetical protein
MTLKSLVSVHSTNTIKENPEQRKPRHTHSTRDVIVKKKYKVDLTDHNIRPYSFMLVVLQKMQKEGDFVADVAFLSSSYSDRTKDGGAVKEDIESIKESELADLIKRYRIFVKCIKTAEQKELSRRSKNASQRINLLSVIQLIAKGMNTSHIKKSMIAKSAYLKKATASTVNVRKVISDFHELKNNSIKREIYTRINVGNTLVTTTSTIELDADIVTILQKQPEVTNLTIRNFILNIHMSNVSLSTFLLLNKVNHIFSNFGMIIGFSRMTTTPISVSNLPNLLLAPLDPFSIIGVALPMGLFIFIPRIAHLMIKYRIRNMSFSAKRNVVIGKS